MRPEEAKRMAKPHLFEEEVWEGTGAEIAEQLRQPERAGRRFRVVSLPQIHNAGAGGAEPPIAANEQALAILRQIAERHKGRRTTDNRNTMPLLREARSGAAYGYDPGE